MYALSDSMQRRRLFDIVSPIRAKDRRPDGGFARYRAGEPNLAGVPGSAEARGAGTDRS
jgi:hypothetical protein